MNTQPQSNTNPDEVKIEVSNSNPSPVPAAPPAQPAEPIFTPENQPVSTPVPVAPIPAPQNPPTNPPVTPPPQEPQTPPAPPSPPQQQTPPAAQIDTGQYDIGRNPVKEKTGHPVAVITLVAILFLGVGFGGGFYGYKYIPKLKNMLSTSADTSTPQASTTDTSTSLKTYTNAKYTYSIQYPASWSVSPDDPQAKTIQFTSYKPDTSGAGAGLKVEIVFQDSNGKTLKSWVEANNVTSGIVATPTAITVDGQQAYQQKVNSDTKNVSTYVMKNNRVMAISYYASNSEFATGETTYDQMLQSIKLQ